MFNNFTISVQKEDDTLRMKLEGDFNASSAQQLLYHMRMHCAGVSSIIIDTSRLQHLDAFGLNLLRYHFRWFHQKDVNLVFTGVQKSFFLPIRITC
jgi:anti-anti-sigma factor